LVILDILPLISPSDIVSMNELTVILKIIGQCQIHYDVTDKNNSTSFQGLNIHYQ